VEEVAKNSVDEDGEVIAATTMATEE